MSRSNNDRCLSNSKENLQLDPSAARGAQGRRAIRKDHCPGSVIERVFADTSRKKQVPSKETTVYDFMHRKDRNGMIASVFVNAV